MFIASHDVDFLAECVSRLIILRDGHIAEDGAAHGLLTDATTLDSYGYDVPEVVSFLLSTGALKPSDLSSLSSMDDIWMAIRIHRGD